MTSQVKGHVYNHRYFPLERGPGFIPRLTGHPVRHHTDLEKRTDAQSSTDITIISALLIRQVIVRVADCVFWHLTVIPILFGSLQ